MIELEVAAFLTGSDVALRDRLAAGAMQQFRGSEAAQLRAWAVSLRCLRAALSGWAEAGRWRLPLEFKADATGFACQGRGPGAAGGGVAGAGVPRHEPAGGARGDPADRTRDPAELDAVAAFLADCGARAAADVGLSGGGGSTGSRDQALLV